MIRLAIFASGSGSNAEQIVRYFENNKRIKVVSIVSNKSNAFVLERAHRLGIPTQVFSNDRFREGNSIIAYLKEQQVDFIVLAGFLLKIPSSLLKEYPFRIVNIHPALLPKFGGKGMYGMHVHQAVVDNGETQTGITIHYINEHYDEGDIIFQADCPVFKEDTPEQVAERVHELEHRFFPKVIEQIVLDLPKR